MYIFSYKHASASARSLSRQWGFKRIRHDRSRFRGRPNKTVINWGASQLTEEVLKCVVLNPSSLVEESSNKLSFFEKMKSSKICPIFTESREEAARWIGRGRTVVCRTLLNASGGRGITIAASEEELVAAPLYVRYVKKQEEYRIHIVKDKAWIDNYTLEVFDVQRKVRRQGAEPLDWRVRNHDNGFIFQRENINPPASVIAVAKKCLDKTGLDFGAVDVIFNGQREKAYVLEVNTAPGLEGTSVSKYGEMFRHYF